MASGTDGQIITYDASGNPTAVGPGTDGQVLTSTGAGSPPAFEDAAGGGATINNATANELVTVASTTTQLDAESGLTFDGTHLSITDGDLVIGTAGHGIDFSASGQGTDSASQTTELLSDYEEGTFNMILNSHQGTVSGTYTNQVGKYCKVGRNVTVHGTLSWNAQSGMGGYPRLEGLPFLGSINGSQQASLHFSNIDGFTAGSDQGTESDWTWASMWIGSNSKNMTPWRMKWGGNYPLQTSGGCDKNQGTVSFSGSYIAYQAS